MSSRVSIARMPRTHWHNEHITEDFLMAPESGSSAEQTRVLAAVGRLVTAADGDTVYRDVYLRRAAATLSPFVSEARYASALTGREQLAKLLAQARAAVARQDWPHVQEIGTQAADLQRSLDAEKSVLSVAEAVYGAPAVVLDPFSPGVSSKRWPGASQARAELDAALVDLERDDPEAHDLYASRKKALEAITVASGPTPEAKTGTVSAANVEMQAMEALERGDASALRNLAESMLGRRAAAQPGAESTPTAHAAIAVPAVLGEPLPEACLPAAQALGLERIETTLVTPGVAAAVTSFIERYALGASPAVHDRSTEGVARVAVAAEEIDIPPEVAAIFAETISLFALNVFVNSAGVRYVPLPAPREVLLLETHADGDETVTPLLRELGLDRRRCLSRDDIEDRLHASAARVLGERLGLDPLAFRIVCVPPDVYMRVGRDRGWGTRPEWTHFDGYQVMKSGNLRALVGGNSKFGGLFDLCSISRDDARDNTFVRFAVIRRERLGVRIG
jgi:hypothetical protein